MSDEIIGGHYRGWGDRVADGLAKKSATFTYANLAVRGKLLPQVIEDQIPIALSYVTGPDTLISFHAGANDALRPGFDPALAKERYQSTVRKLAASGATIMLFTVLEDTGNSGRGSKLWQERFGTFNKGVREIAAEVGAIIVDANGERFCADAVLEKLGYEFDPGWRTPLPPAQPTPWIKERAIGVMWFFVFALPWIIRRLRGRSSGDGRVCKYPTPISWPR